MEFGRLVFFLEFDSSRSLHEPWVAFPLEVQSEPLGRVLVAQSDFAGITTFHRRESYFQLRPVFIRGDRFEFLAARYGLLQNGRIVQSLINLGGRAGEIVCPLDDHEIFNEKSATRSGRTVG